MWLELGLRGVRSAANSGFFDGLLLASSSRFRRSRRSGERSGTAAPREPAGAGKGHAISPWPNVLTEPLVLTVPRDAFADDLPEFTTTAPLVVPPQPTLTTAQAPSKLPPPPPPPLPRREATSGSSVAGLLRREGAAGSAERPEEVSWREPDSDFSSLPIEPPALPDCAKADDEARARLRRKQQGQS